MTLHPLNVAALRAPPGGYAASFLFRPAPFVCPECAGPVWVRVPLRSLTPVGVTCAHCPWLGTYAPKPRLPPPPHQPRLF